MRDKYIKTLFILISLISVISFSACNKNLEEVVDESESIQTETEKDLESSAEQNTNPSEQETKQETIQNTTIQNTANYNATETQKSTQYTTTNNSVTTTKSATKVNQDVAKQIIAHKSEWLQIDNEYSQKVSYDPITVSMISLYPTDTKRTYKMVVTYPLGTVTYAPIFLVNASSFKYVRTITDSDEYKNLVFGSVYSGEAALAATGIDLSNPDNNIYELCDLAYYNENKYFDSIELKVEDNIVLQGDDKLLYNNLWNALYELEYHQHSNGIISKLNYIEYHDFGGGECKAIFHYVGTYISFSITQYGYNELTYSDEQILKNSSLHRIDWDPTWTTEKKQYNLKYAIYNS